MMHELIYTRISKVHTKYLSVWSKVSIGPAIHLRSDARKREARDFKRTELQEVMVTDEVSEANRHRMARRGHKVVCCSAV